MKFLMDTNVISELRKNRHKPIDKNVDLWTKSVDSKTLYISVITIYEIKLAFCSLNIRINCKEQ